LSLRSESSTIVPWR